ncbi:non-ribosomal peptide synthetase [Sciscionella marina]|uniref:non-ribosomal peptide synthetase n=1 Tax=Sciscionella marina TaxID=508770 RepID=UPI000369419C|nr:non-ribosomal peptide synthetase [Sciscionella marina]
MSGNRIEDVLPLSPLQLGFLFHALYDERAEDVYTMQLRLELDGELDAARLRHAFETLIERHPNLRAGFRQRRNGETVQVIPKQVRLPWRELDLSDMDSTDTETHLEKLLAEERSRTFTLSSAPLLRVLLVRLTGDRHVVALTNHHILLDGWSLPLLVRQLFTTYAGEELPHTTPYRDYHGWLADRDTEAAHTAWRAALDGLGAPPLLADAAEREPVHPRRIVTELSEQQTERLTAFAREHDCTPNTVLQAAWGLLLGSLTGAEDVVFGSTVSGRPPELPGSGEMIGLFINTVPVRVRLRPQESVSALLHRIQDEQAELLEHQHLPLTDIQKLAGGGTLFDSLVVFENYPLEPDALELPGTGLRLRGASGQDATHYPFAICAIPGPRLRLCFDHREDLLPAAAAERIAARLCEVLTAMLENPERPVAAIPVTAPEEHSILRGTGGEIEESLLDAFGRHVAANPDEPAMLGDGIRLSYRELDERANRLAHRLLAAGVGAEHRVAIRQRRSPEFAVAVLAVLKAGAIYVPLDMRSPRERLAHMLGAAGVAVLLTDTASAGETAVDGITSILVDEPATDYPATDPGIPVHPEQLAYIMFTSGSTGVPKGVGVRHKDIVALGADRSWDTDRHQRVLLHSPFAFDMSTCELWCQLLRGRQVVVAPDGELDSQELARLIREHEVSTVLLTAGLFRTFAEEDPHCFTGVREVWSGGDVVPAATVRAVLDANPGIVVGDGYGPAEATAFVCRHLMRTVEEVPDTVPIGAVIDGTRLYVLDDFLRPVPHGSTGELYIGGAGLARGYWAAPGQTAQRFLADPFEPGARMYRTGDLVRRIEDPHGVHPEGILEFAGRCDEQVKIRGFRVEPGEIAAVLGNSPELAQVAVVTRQTPRGKQLIAYYVPEGADPGAGRLAEWTGERLPEYQVPAAFVAMSALPLTTNGKIDQAALPEPELGVRNGEHTAPRDETERQLCELFAQVLGVEEIGVHDSFFALGGDSIVSIQLASRARKAGLRISPKDIFTHRTVAGLAAAATPVQETQAPQQESGIGPVELTPIMHWLRELGGEIDGFCQSVSLIAPRGLTVERLRTLAQTVLDAHDALRMRLRREHGNWSLDIPEPGAITARVQRIEVGGDLAGATAKALDQARAQLDPGTGDLVRFVWLDAADTGRLLIVAHHLAVDGVSWRILTGDLAEAWQAVREDATPALEPVPTAYRGWAARLRETASGADAAAWARLLDQPDPPLSERALDPNRDTADTVRHLDLALPPEIADPLLGTVPEAFHTGAQEVLLSGLALACAGWRARRGTPGTATLLDLETHGRDGTETDLTRTVGWFTTMYPVRLELDGIDLGAALRGGAALNGVVGLVKDQLRALPGAASYGQARYLDPETGPVLAAGATPQIGFNYLGRFTAGSQPFTPAPESAGLGGGADAKLPAPHALEVTVTALEDGLHARLSWPEAVLAETEIAELGRLFTEALTALAGAEGGYSPSDFPLAALDAAQLVALEREHAPLAEVLPLSPLAKGLFFHAAYGEDPYVVQLGLRLYGELDVERLRAALSALLDRHPNLASGFTDRGLSAPVQFSRTKPEVPFRLIETSEAELDGLRAADREEGFDLAEPPLLRLIVFALGSGQHEVMLTNHHLLLDGWSAPLLVHELFALYAGQRLDPPAQYRDYLEWLATQDIEAAKQDWHRALDEAEPTLLCAHSEAEAEQRRHTITFPRALTEGLSALAAEAGVTLNTVLQSLWSVLLGRLTGREDVLFGATVSGRPAELPGVESMIGLFINTVPVRVRPGAADSFRALLSTVQSEQTALQAQHYLGLSDIQETLGSGELFDTLLVFENYPLESALELPGTGLRAEAGYIDDATHYPLTVVAVPGAELELRLNHRPDLVDAEAIGARLRTLAERVLAAPDAELSTMDVLPETERAMLRELGTGAPQQEAVRGVHESFAEEAARHPEATALLADGVRIGYGELDARANRLANRLLTLGVTAEERIALLLERGPELVVATLAVLKAGAAYVPLDARNPEGRLTRILEHTGARLLISDTEPGFAHGCELVDPARTQDFPATDPGITVDPQRLAYVMFTSGSTGVPKGVAVRHADVLALAADRCWDTERQERVLLHSPHAFDASTYELWAGLLHGRELVLAPAGELDIRELAETIREQGITGLWLTAGLFRLLAEEEPGCFANVREVWSGGDVVPASAVHRVFEVNPALVFGDGYGPTETTTFATRHLMRSVAEVPDTVPIGSPMDGMRCYVLDERLRPVPHGTIGELYLAGAGLARGYLDEPGLSANRFVADPFAAGARMYRTGDLVRWTAGRALEFAGRVDEQAKIRGFRIELGEIEAVLGRAEGIGQVAVLVREDRPGDKRLVAYYVGTANEEQLRALAEHELPGYMVPAAFCALDRLPLTANGKLDRRALPEPVYAGAAEGRSARNRSEQVLCELFAEALNLTASSGNTAVGIDDNFFAMGGHSLLATRLVSRIRSAFGVELAVRNLFDSPTVAGLVTALDNAADARQTLCPMPRGERIPASFGQRRLWFLNKLEPENSPYKIPIGIRLSGALDVSALEAAIADVLARHEVLCTVYPEFDGEPYQVILPAEQIRPTLDPVAVTESGLGERMLEEVRRPFDLHTEPPLRPVLFRIGETEHVLLLTLHHIAGDGWSMAPLARDLSEAYTARLRGSAPGWAPLPVQYADYSIWQRQVMGTEQDKESRIAQQVEYWRCTLDGIPDELTLPADRPRPAVSENRGGVELFEVDSALHAKLAALASAEQVSMFMLFQAALAGLLTRLGAGEDVPIGSPIAGRTDAALDELVGFFVNTLVLRADTAGDPRFTELLERVRHTDLAAYANQDLPFERLVEVLNPVREIGRNPLFQVMLVVQNNVSAELELPELSVRPQPVGAYAAQFDLSFDLTERTEGGVTGRLDYSSELFDASTARTIVERFLRLLHAIAEQPETRLSAVDVLGARERARLLEEFNASARPESCTDLVACVQEFAARTPEAIALRDDTEALSYAELAGRASALSRTLLAAGAGRGSVVGVYAPRGTDVPVAVLGILGAGAAYLPLDPASPDARIADMLERADAQLVLAAPDLVAHAKTLGGQALVLPIERRGDEPGDLARGVGKTGDLAYVLYTSGSTGKPKGALVHRRGMLNHLLAKVEELDLCATDTVVQNAPLSFDISIWQMLCAFTVGATTRVVGGEDAADPARLFGLVDSERITGLEVVPSLLRTALESWETGAATPGLGTLRWLMVTGEALPADLVDRWFERYPGIPMVNAYGPTECSDDVTHARLTADTELDGARVPIGSVVRNTQLYVLDEQLNPVPLGVAGELCVGGIGVGYGYLGDPVKTANAFVPDPFGEVPGARLYRTGDQARYRADGQLEFLGRNDHQVKIRGQRIELSEVESALRGVPGVRDAVVVASGHERLIGYYAGETAPEVVRAALETTLTQAMVPAVLMPLPALPLSANGKVDRAKLPEPELTATSGRRPSTPQEEILCTIFAEVLGRAEPGVDEDFFALGGHSLLATRLVNRIRVALDAELEIREVFANPTVARIARLLAEKSGTTRPRLGARERGERVPLSFAQRRLWFLNRMDAATGAYNVPIGLRLHGELDADALRAALGDLLARHESLRTVFPQQDDEPHQWIVEAELARPRLRFVETDEHRLPGELDEAVRTGFDLTAELPIRGWLYRLGAGEHVLLLLVHHIACDGGSAVPLATDLATAYRARTAGAEPGWAPLPVQYADYALWQRDVLGAEDDPESLLAGQLDHWRSTLDGLPDELALPADRPRPAESSMHGESVPIRLPAGLHAGLAALAREHGASLFMVLHAGLAALLSRLGAGEDVPIGSPIAGRTDAALDELVGFFVNTLVLRTDVSGDPSFAELLDRARRTDLAAYANQDLPFERLVEELNPPRALARHPLFQVMLVLANQETGSASLDGLTVEALPLTNGAAKFDLSCHLAEAFTEEGAAAGIEGRLDYRTELFDRASAEHIAAALERLLSAAVAEPQRPVTELELLAPGRRDALLVAGPRVDRDTASLPELLAAQAIHTPDAIALADARRSYRYAELVPRVNRLAHLLREHGAGQGTFVAVALPAGTELVVALLAVLRAGAAYVPIDPEYPDERVRYMLEDSAPVAVLAGEGSAIEGIDVAGELSDYPDSAPEGTPLPGDPAYVIYTSGSTGRPKGVVVEHRSLSDYLGFARTAYSGMTGKTVLHTSVSFDLSVTALLTPLTAGGTVHVGELGSAPATLVKATPSHLPMFAAAGPGAVPSEQLLLGGEQLTGEAVRELRAGHPELTVLNTYGPTEATVNVTQYRVEPGTELPDGPVPIGRPMDNARVYVLDARLRPVDTGVPGELYLAGESLARGYLNRPGQTATAFVADPFVAGERMYRTGDLVRWDHEGNLRYLRRADEQVKLRGFRIEPGEIEAVLSGLGDVGRAAVLVREDSPGDQRLVGYVEPELDAGTLRAALTERLPAHLVPSAVVALPELPRTPSGKVDRGALPAPELDGSRAIEAPRDHTERELCRLFAETLGVGEVSVHEGFFELGGHSLLATALLRRVRATFGVDLPVRALFEAPTVAGLAARLGTGEPTGGYDMLLGLRPRGAATPLFCVHPASGFSWSYAGLLRHLDKDIPVYGLQSRGLDTETELPGSLAGIAAEYLEQIRTVQPQGPYRLLGWSFGGLVAQEIAAALREAGEEVELLALLDAAPHEGGVRDEVFAETVLAEDELYRSLLDLVGVDQSSLGTEPVGAERAAELLTERGGLFAEADADTLRRLHAVFTNNVAVADRHTPRPFDGTALLFVAEHEPDRIGAHRWAGLLGEVHEHPIAARHNDLTMAEPLAAIGALLAARMTEGETE